MEAKKGGRQTKDFHLGSADRNREQHQTETAATVAAFEASPTRRQGEMCVNIPKLMILMLHDAEGKEGTDTLHDRGVQESLANVKSSIKARPMTKMAWRCQA